MCAVAQLTPRSASAARCFVVHRPAVLDKGSKTAAAATHHATYDLPLPSLPKLWTCFATGTCTFECPLATQPIVIFAVMCQSLSPSAACPTALSVQADGCYSLMASLAMELDRLLGETLSRDVRFMDCDIDCTCAARKPRSPEHCHERTDRSLATQSCAAAQLHCTSSSA